MICFDSGNILRISGNFSQLESGRSKRDILLITLPNNGFQNLKLGKFSNYLKNDLKFNNKVVMLSSKERSNF